MEPNRRRDICSGDLLIACGQLSHIKRTGWLFMIVLLCITTIVLVATTTSQLADASDPHEGGQALRLHLQSTGPGFDQRASEERYRTSRDSEAPETNDVESSHQPPDDNVMSSNESNTIATGTPAYPPGAAEKTSEQYVSDDDKAALTLASVDSKPVKVPSTGPPEPTYTQVRSMGPSEGPSGNDHDSHVRVETPTSVPIDQPRTDLNGTANITLRVRHEAFDQSVSRERGIIISLHDYAVPLGLSLIKDLRCMGNNELIQVYHCFSDELSFESRELLLMNETRLEIVDVCTFYTENGKLPSHIARSFRSWWLKPLALVHTDLREVVLLDADVIPMRDPAVLRSVAGYERTGTAFFYDRVISAPMFFNADVRGPRGQQGLQAWIDLFDYVAFNLTGPAPSSHLLQSLAYNRKTCHEMDSSMVAVDKARAGKAMDVLWFLITEMRFKFEFSWGDKESFWLAYEVAHVEYAFSPWGVTVVSSYTNRDMEEHPNTLCGSMAQFMPVEDDTPQLLYVNGKALIDPYPVGIDNPRAGGKNLHYNLLPTHMTPRHVRAAITPREKPFFQECLVDMGSTPLPLSFQQHLLRRRTFYTGIRMGVYSVLRKCDAF